MSEHFNKLTPVQAELLALLAEECAEVIQAIGKIQRHGLQSYHPTTRVLNLDALAKELGDVRAAVILLDQQGGMRGALEEANLRCLAGRKLNKVGKYLHHAKLATSRQIGEKQI